MPHERNIALALIFFCVRPRPFAHLRLVVDASNWRQNLGEVVQLRLLCDSCARPLQKGASRNV